LARPGRSSVRVVALDVVERSRPDEAESRGEAMRCLS
jgi:hypothetical protein